MTGSNTIRALLLTALTITAAAVGAVAFAGPAAATPSAATPASAGGLATQTTQESNTPTYEVDGSETDTVYVGQTLNVTGLEPNTQYRLRSVDATDGTEITASTLRGTVRTNDEGAVVGIDTADLRPGRYFLRGPNVSETTDATVELVEQTLSTSFEAESVANRGDTTAEIAVDSNRDEFDVAVSAEGFDSGELAVVFAAEEPRIAGEESIVIEDVGGAIDANLSGVDAGESEFAFEAVDTGAADAASVTVENAGEASLARTNTTVPRGGVATLTVEFDGTVRTATVLVGDERADGYQANVTVTDGDNDGQVTVAFDTYTAGNTSADANAVRVAGDSVGADEVEFNGTTDQTELSGLLEAGDYVVSVGTDEDPAAVRETPDQLATLFVAERDPPGQALWRAPPETGETIRETAAGDGNATAAVLGAVENGTLTRTDTLAVDPAGESSDILVHRVTAPGLSGVLGTNGTGGDVTDAFLAAVAAPEGDDAALHLRYEERPPDLNRPPATVNVSEALADDTGIADALTVVAAGNDTYYVVLEYDAVPTAAFADPNVTFEDGDTVATEFTLRDRRLLDGDAAGADGDGTAARGETASANVTVEAAEGGFAGNDSDVVTATAAERAEISGTTTVAPGTAVVVSIRSTDDTTPAFSDTRTVAVAENGTFAAAFNLSEQSPGDAFEVSVDRAAFSATADGVVVAENATAGG